MSDGIGAGTSRPDSSAARRAAISGLLLGLVALLSVGSRPGGLPMWKALLLGAVEGITEYLPVSSTGHLLVAARMLGLGDVSDGSALGTYVIAVQVGAILPVLGLSCERLRSLSVAAVGGAVEVRYLAAAPVTATRTEGHKG